MPNGSVAPSVDSPSDGRSRLFESSKKDCPSRSSKGGAPSTKENRDLNTSGKDTLKKSVYSLGLPSYSADNTMYLSCIIKNFAKCIIPDSRSILSILGCSSLANAALIYWSLSSVSGSCLIGRVKFKA